MESNTHSTRTPGWLTALETEVKELPGQDRSGLGDASRAEGILALRGLLDRLEGVWLQELAAVDAHGAAGAEQGQPAPSTAGWLRARLRMGASAANSCVRTARALYHGPLTQTGRALTAGELSPAHAQVLAHGTGDLPAHTAAEAEPVLLEAARRLDPPQLRRAVAHLRWVADPDTAERQAQRRHARRGLWLAPTLDGMVAVDGWLEPEAGQTLLAALEPLARPADAEDERSGPQRRADALAEVARRALEGGRLPQTGGVRPQLLVTVDLDTLLGHHGAPGLGGEVDWAGPLDPEECRRLACDAAVTRVLVTRHPTHHHPGDDGGLAARLRAAAALLPRPSGAPRPSRWRWAAAAGSSAPPNAPRWWSATAAARWRAVSDRRAGARPIICATGSTAARQIWPTWRWCAGPIIGRSMRAAGGFSAIPMGG
jgi:Domain of unknown function (DUF222)